MACSWIAPQMVRWVGQHYQLRELYVPAVLELLLIGASDLQKEGLIHSSMSENMISALLNQHMRTARMANDISDILSWFMRTAIPKNPQGSPGSSRA